MNQNDLIKQVSVNLNLNQKQVAATLALLEAGATVPFIARYRKETTGNLNEDQIRDISEQYEYQQNLTKRKTAIIENLKTKELLTTELEQAILQCNKLVELENIYKPYKENKKTKASIAIKQGLKPLAEWMLGLPKKFDLIREASKYLNQEVKTVDEAITGAKYIIAEIVANDLEIRSLLKTSILKYGFLLTTLKPKAVDESETFKVYYDFKQKVTYLSSYQVMAINRGEDKKILSVKLDYQLDFTLKQAYWKYTKNFASLITDHIREAVDDGFKRLLIPSVENEIRNELTEKAEQESILRFAHNLEQLLCQPPMVKKNVLGWDPGYRTGCKLAAISSSNEVKAVGVVHPFDKPMDAEKTVLKLLQDYSLNLIAIGNGTASRESEEFISNLIKKYQLPCDYCIVSEAGASVYSASKTAQKEFPDLTVEKRSAISIGRRIIDPLAELIKIPSLSIGVGQYQHDLPEKQLNQKLDFVVEKVVNRIGVDVNTASEILLSHISGLTTSIAQNIVDYRNQNGNFTSRQQLLKVKGLSDKRFEQAAGFLRVIGDQFLDRTEIHPESYPLATQIMNQFAITNNELGTKAAHEKVQNANLNALATQFHSDIYTIQDILKGLSTPLRDYREQYPQPLLRHDILHIENLKEGMTLQGTVRNIVDFGAFVDLGIKESALLHISQMTDQKHKTPYDIVNINDIITVQILSLDLKSKKIQVKLVR